jgi:hypothetical protein
MSWHSIKNKGAGGRWRFSRCKQRASVEESCKSDPNPKEQGAKTMEPISVKVENTGMSLSIEAAKGFLAKLAGPATEELDFLLYDSVKMYRLRNQLRILGKAQKILESAKSEPNVVPFRTLIRILEGAALEDDETLITKWAALLANAAKETNSFATHPSFPKILAELVPLEAQFIDILAEKGIVEWLYFRKKLAERLQTSEASIDHCYGNLFRLDLVRLVDKSVAMVGSVDNYIEITPFGKSFLLACCPSE